MKININYTLAAVLNLLIIKYKKNRNQIFANREMT